MSHLSTGQTEVERDATRKRSFSLRTFCDRNDVGLTTAYAEIRAGRLIVHKAGARTLVFEEDEDAWRASLPKLRRQRDAAAHHHPRNEGSPRAISGAPSKFNRPVPAGQHATETS
jgi:hypothetical protein